MNQNRRIKVLLIGETGLLGSSFERYFRLISFKDYRTISRSGNDISLDLTKTNELIKILDSFKPLYIINCAADLSVNNSQPTLMSWSINTKLLETLTNFCKSNKSKLLHFSTDQYYTIGEDKLHKEDEKVSLMNTYAVQKYSAEKIALLDTNSLVVRTSFVGFDDKQKNNLLYWILNEFKSSLKTNIYCDAWTTSLYVDDLVVLSCRLVFGKNATGLYNLGTQTAYTKADLFQRLAKSLKVNDAQYILTRLADLNPKRPRSLGLDSSKASKILKCKMPTFDQTIEKIVENMKGRLL